MECGGAQWGGARVVGTRGGACVVGTHGGAQCAPAAHAREITLEVWYISVVYQCSAAGLIPPECGGWGTAWAARVDGGAQQVVGCAAGGRQQQVVGRQAGRLVTQACGCSLLVTTKAGSVGCSGQGEAGRGGRPAACGWHGSTQASGAAAQPRGRRAAPHFPPTSTGPGMRTSGVASPSRAILGKPGSLGGVERLQSTYSSTPPPAPTQPHTRTAYTCRSRPVGA